MRLRLLPLLLMGCLGLGSLMFVPSNDARSLATEPVAPASSIALPNPLLIKTLNEAVKPPVTPSPTDTVAATPEQESTPATAQPAVETTDLAMVDPEQLQPPPQPQAGSRVGGSAVTLRSGPSSGAGRISVLQAGTAVAVIETSKGWVHVRAEDGRDGWIYGRFLAGGSDQVAAKKADTPKKARSEARASVSGSGNLENRMARVAGTLPVRTRPTAGAPAQFTLEPGERVRILSVRKGWMQVETQTGETGWVQRG